ncbi:MAG TPA: hypothetical protein VD767_06465 [Thermomicrobiales bacterium]|nr:hypothetical protein [Thermomicrobiales bacterium]
MTGENRDVDLATDMIAVQQAKISDLETILAGHETAGTPES